MAAEGGYDIPDEAKDTDPLITYKGDDEEVMADIKEWDQLPAEEKRKWLDAMQRDTSTPSGEQVPMNQITGLSQEKQGMQPGPSGESYPSPPERGPRTQGTSFIEGTPSGRIITMQEEFALKELEQNFPFIDKSRLEARNREAPRSGGAVLEVKMQGKAKWYPVWTKSKGDAQKTFNSKMPKEIKNALGLDITEIQEAMDAHDKEIAERDRLIQEDQRVANDENEEPANRERAREKVQENTEIRDELVAENERLEEKLPLRERVKRVFKKYGWTLQAVVLAAGITISAVVLATLNGLAKATKAIGNGLKELGKKAAAALPGLIGSIVSFLFKAAGSVISFLGEHAWLLILAVVAFLVERVTKRARKS